MPKQAKASQARTRCHVLLQPEIRKWIDTQGIALGMSRGQVVETLARKARAGKIPLGE